MPYHIVDLLRDGSTNFTATETNLTNLQINGTPRTGLWLVGTHQGITGGTNASSTVTASTRPTGGTFTLTIGGRTTAAIPYNATAAQVLAALMALKNLIIQNIWYPVIPLGAIAVTGGPLSTADLVIAFANDFANQPIAVTGAGGSLTGVVGFAVNSTVTGVGPTCAVTLQHGDDAVVWDAWRKFGTLDIPVSPRFRAPLLFETPRKYVSSTNTFGGTGVFKNLQLAVVYATEGIG